MWADRAGKGGDFGLLIADFRLQRRGGESKGGDGGGRMKAEEEWCERGEQGRKSKCNHR